MELLLSVISLGLAIYERIERQAEKRRIRCGQLTESEAQYAPFDHLLWTRGNETIAS